MLSGKLTIHEIIGFIRVMDFCNPGKVSDFRLYYITAHYNLIIINFLRGHLITCGHLFKQKLSSSSLFSVSLNF